MKKALTGLVALLAIGGVTVATAGTADAANYKSANYTSARANW